MNERQSIKNALSFIDEESLHRDMAGNVDSRKFLVGIEGKYFNLLIGTPAYIVAVRKLNGERNDPDLKVDDNILPMVNVVSLEDAVERIYKIPLENLKPFLSEINPIEEAG